MDAGDITFGYFGRWEHRFRRLGYRFYRPLLRGKVFGRVGRRSGCGFGRWGIILDIWGAISDVGGCFFFERPSRRATRLDVVGVVRGVVLDLGASLLTSGVPRASKSQDLLHDFEGLSRARTCSLICWAFEEADLVHNF